MEGITVDGGGELRIGAGEEKVRDGVLVLRLTVVGTYSLFMASGQTFHATLSCFGNIFALQIVLGF